MAIGQVKLGGTPLQYTSDAGGNKLAQVGTGIATALKKLSGSMEAYDLSIEDMADAALREERRRETFDAQASWAETQGQWTREQVDALNAAPQNGSGLTNARAAELEKKRQAFLSTLPAHLRPEFDVRTTESVQSLVTNTYGEEFRLRTNYESEVVTKQVSQFASSIMAGEIDRDAALGALDATISLTGLSEDSKVKLREAAFAELSAVEFHKELQKAATGQGTAGPADGKNPVAAGLTPWQRGFLNVTAKRESGGDYSVRFNGKTPAYITDFSRHPAIFVDTGHGDVSSAAGRYQITYSTWQEYAPRVGVTDFSPRSQDLVALAIAEDRYNSQIGAGEPTFAQIMQSGNDDQLLGVKRALGPTWVAFQSMSDQEFLNVFKGSEGLAGGGTGTSQLPNIWTDPRYEGVPYDQKLALANQTYETSKAMQKQLQDQQTALKDMLAAALASGDPNAPAAINQAVADGKVALKDQPELLSKIKAYNEETSEAARFATAVGSGQVLGNTAENQAAAMALYKRNGTFTGLSQLDQAAAQRFQGDFSRTGVLPKDVGELLQSMVGSSNPKNVAYAGELLSALQASPGFASTASKELAEAADTWSLLKRYSPDGNLAQVAQKFVEMNSPEQAQLRSAWADEARENLKEITPKDILGAFTSALDFSTDLPLDEGSRTLIFSDFRRLYQQNFPRFGNDKQTREFVAQQMKYQWGVDETSGSPRLMYLAPTSPRAGLSHLAPNTSWIRDDIVEGLDLDPSQEFSLVSDAQTEAQIARGEPASWKVFVPGPYGELVLKTNPDGTPVRVQPELSPGRKDALLAREQVQQIVPKIDALQKELDDLAASVAGDPVRTQNAEPRMIELGDELNRLRGLEKELGAKARVSGESTVELREQIRRLEGQLSRIPENARASRYENKQLEVLRDKLRALGETP